MTIIIISESIKGENMDFKKIADDFEKRFCRKCEKIFFCGMPLTILKSESFCLSAVLSIGGSAALARRRDGRFTAGFDGNKKYISENVIEAELHRSEPMIGFLIRVKDQGAKLGGADILFEYNTGIYNEYEPLLLSSMYWFCKNMPAPGNAKSCLSYRERDFAALCGVENTLLLSGEKNVYIKFSDRAVKIVICHIDGENKIPHCNDETLINAAKILSLGDYRRFGELITQEYRQSDLKNAASKNLFEAALEQKDALGIGIAESGGIFAIVENKKVNAFIQNLKKEYETYYGSAPGFYVTRTENSGIYGRCPV